jgi:glutathione peroxidase-family protein
MRNAPRLRTAAPALLSALLLALPLAPGRAGAIEPGRIVPFFKAADLEGAPVSLGDVVAARRVALLFWDWRRATSTRAMQELDRLQERYAKQGLAVVAVEGEGSTAAQVLERVEKLRAIGVRQRYTIVPDPGGRIARQFQVADTPQIFLVDGAGRVVRHFEGMRAGDEAELELRVRELLGVEVPVARAPAAAAPAVPAPAAPAAAPPRPAAPEDPARALVDKYRYFGNFHFNRGEPDKAEEYFRKLVALAPGDVAGWLRLGDACAAQNRYDQAREAWEAVQRLDPGNAEADASIRRLIRGEF